MRFRNRVLYHWGYSNSWRASWRALGILRLICCCDQVGNEPGLLPGPDGPSAGWLPGLFPSWLWFQALGPSLTAFLGCPTSWTLKQSALSLKRGHGVEDNFSSFSHSCYSSKRTHSLFQITKNPRIKHTHTWMVIIISRSPRACPILWFLTLNWYHTLRPSLLPSVLCL